MDIKKTFCIIIINANSLSVAINMRYHLKIKA